MMLKMNAIILLIALLGFADSGDPLTGTEIVRRAEEKLRGESSRAELKMSIVRPDWSREIEMKSWSKGTDYALILITAPPREEGTAFLMRETEIWNWQPSIDRVIKLPPSMMMQSWMGSDFTNDDLIKESSILEDYEHRLVGRGKVDDRSCYEVELTPKPDAAVVWGRVVMWIDTEHFMQLKAEFFDEDGGLVNTMYGREVEELGGKLLPSVLEMVPADDPGHKTVVRYRDLEFDLDIKEDFFSVRNMKRLRAQ